MKKIAVLFALLLFSPAISSAYTNLFNDDFEALRARLETLSPMQMDEVLWLARCVYSESNLENEQEHIAWVVRNRVETKYRGETYREVILEPLQFSLFNQNTPRRNYILGLNQNSEYKHWHKALRVALNVYQADADERPFSINTRHFYSPISMENGKTPEWAENVDPLNSRNFDIDPERFLFFEEIDESGDPFMALESPKDHIDKFNAKTEERLAPVKNRKGSIRDRLKPSGRVLRPARPYTRSTRSN